MVNNGINIKTALTSGCDRSTNYGVVWVRAINLATEVETVNVAGKTMAMYRYAY